MRALFPHPQAGARIRKLKGHKDYINSVAAPRQDKPLFVTGGDDRTVRLWDARRRGHVALLESKYQVTSVSFNGDVDEVISAGLDNDVKIWDLRKNEVIHRLKGHTGEAGAGWGWWRHAPEPACRRPFRARSLGLACPLLTAPVPPSTDTVTSMALSPDGKTLVTNGMDNTVRAWDVQPFAAGDRMMKVFLGGCCGCRWGAVALAVALADIRTVSTP